MTRASAPVERPTVTVVLVEWLPRYGRHSMYFPDAGVLAISCELYEGGQVEATLARFGIEMRDPEPRRPLILHVTCPLCGRSDQPTPGRRPTVNDLGLLRRR